MKRNVMRKNLRQSILKSLGRYIAIVAIIALGSGMFVGLLATKTDMVATAQKYTDEMNMFDLRLLSTYGWTQEDVQAVGKMDGVADAEGSITLDVVAQWGSASEEAVYRLHSIPEKISKISLRGGRMPENSDECLVDSFHTDDSVLGSQFVVSESNEEGTLDSLSTKTFTVVGYVSSPLYMDMTRGNTTLGNGTLANFVYIPEEAFQTDYYTEIGVTMEGDYEIYTDAFTEAMENMATALEGDVELLAQDRMLLLKEKGEKEYADGLKEYTDGKAEFEKGKAEALDELAKALSDLESGQAELDKNMATVLDGEKQLADAQNTLNDGAAALQQGKQELAQTKADTYAQLANAYAELTKNYKELTTAQKQVADGLVQLDDGIQQIEAGLEQIKSGIEQADMMIDIMDASISATQIALDLEKGSLIVNANRVEKLEAQLADLQAKRDDYARQRQEAVDLQTTYTAQLEELKKQRTELLNTQKTIIDGLDAIEMAQVELQSNQVQADNQFAAADAKLQASQLELDAAQKELDAKALELADARVQLEDAQKELDDGRAAYEEGKAEADAEFAKAEADLADAKRKLDDARETLDLMTQAQVYILNRNTNVGYLAVDSNSDIVAGVSRVFPAFFLLVAALVCITTMTRMVDDERTQIGLMKALGYSNGAIISKYIVYSGSAAVLGCGLGVVVGSIVFPKILWDAYSIIINITPDIVLKMNWPLNIAVVLAYSVVSLLVTWYCCRRELREVPAELMRPRAPTAGKKIWMEYLPFWKHISFLNKVMFRNVFRYRQRLLMMLVGIGGCTALLLTGFGFRDSIVDIVDYQFAEITTYDMEVYFSEGQTQEQQDAFRQELRSDVDDILFFHKTSVDLEFGDATREISLIASDDNIRKFMDLHNGSTQLGMPGVGETYLTVGTAEAMGIRLGDIITLRDAKMRTLEVEVTGIFDNHIHNFVILRPETIEAQWSETPEYQMAYIGVRDSQDVHAAGAKITGMDDVMNVSISQDVAEQVGSMMDALDMVVVTIVVCAGMLAVIVLYNLTNISITERIREIATIKVLGFNAWETAAYVFKENLFLSAMGSILGLGGGILLLKFVMSEIRIDMVWFTDRLTFLSYIWAVLLTMLSACVVDFLLYFKLEKINMAEALKSVE